MEDQDHPYENETSHNGLFHHQMVVEVDHLYHILEDHHVHILEVHILDLVDHIDHHHKVACQMEEHQMEGDHQMEEGHLFYISTFCHHQMVEEIPFCILEGEDHICHHHTVVDHQCIYPYKVASLRVLHLVLIV